MDTVHSSKTISATHSLLPNSVNSAFLQRSMCVGFLFFFFPVVGFFFVLFCFNLLLVFSTYLHYGFIEALHHVMILFFFIYIYIYKLFLR